MVSGGCFCDKVKVEYDGKPEAEILCHCNDCKKISGGTCSLNYVIDSKKFRITSGTPKEISKTADTGKTITSVFCPDCGTTLYRWGDSFGGIDGKRIVKAGILDDPSIVSNSTPTTELFAGARPSWIPALSGADQKKAMS